MSRPKEQPTIDVLLPVYNVDQYLEDCLASILNQTYSNFNIIAVNDGSTDRSLEILNTFSELYNNIKVITQKNQGLASARNTALKHSTAKYVAFIDSDDFIDKDYLSVLMFNLQEHSVDISICGRYLYFSPEKIINKKRRAYSNKRLLSTEALRALNSFQSFDMSMCCKLIKKSVFNNLVFPVGKTSEDMFVCPELLGKSTTFYDPQPLYFYRQREGSISHDKIIKLDIVEAADFQIVYCIKKYPKLINNALTTASFFRLGIINQHYRKKTLSSFEKFESYHSFITSTYLSTLFNISVPFYKKVQVTIFLLSPRLYFWLLGILSKR